MASKKYNRQHHDLNLYNNTSTGRQQHDRKRNGILAATVKWPAHSWKHGFLVVVFRGFKLLLVCWRRVWGRWFEVVDRFWGVVVHRVNGGFVYVIWNVEGGGAEGVYRCMMKCVVDEGGRGTNSLKVNIVNQVCCVTRDCQSSVRSWCKYGEKHSWPVWIVDLWWFEWFWWTKMRTQLRRRGNVHVLFGFLLDGGILFSEEKKRENERNAIFFPFPLMCVVFMRVERDDFVVSNELLLDEVLVMMAIAK